MHRSRDALLGALALVGALVWAGCTGASQGAAPAGAQPGAATPVAPGAPAASVDAVQPPPLVTVVVGSPAVSLNNAPLELGADKGIYARYGLDVQRVVMAAETNIAGLVSGEVQFTTATGSLARASATGVSGKVLIYLVDLASHSLYAKPTIRSVAELRDVPLGVQSSVSDLRMELEAILLAHGYDPNVMDIRNVGQDRAAALMGGAVDAAVVNPPEDLILERAGYVRLANVKDYTKIPNSGIGASSAYIERNRDVVRRMVAATLEAVEFVKANRQETVEYLARLLDVSPDEARFVYDEIPWAKDGRADPEGLAESLRWIQRTANIPDGQLVRVDEVVDYSILSELQARR
jgi:ABC-type nitrate/sulfonate/bicarbonate transport system substrate-binding protein